MTNALLMRVHCSTAGSGAKREPNMRNFCPSFLAPIRSARNCGFSSAALRSAAEFLPSLRSKSPIRCRRREIFHSRSVLPQRLAGFADAAGRGIGCDARAAKPLGRAGALSSRELLLGAARSRSRLRLLQACRRWLFHIARCRSFAVARRLDRCSEAHTRCCKPAHGLLATLSRLAVHA